MIAGLVGHATREPGQDLTDEGRPAAPPGHPRESGRTAEPGLTHAVNLAQRSETANVAHRSGEAPPVGSWTWPSDIAVRPRRASERTAPVTLVRTCADNRGPGGAPLKVTASKTRPAV